MRICGIVCCGCGEGGDVENVIEGMWRGWEYCGGDVEGYRYGKWSEQSVA